MDETYRRSNCCSHQRSNTRKYSKMFPIGNNNSIFVVMLLVLCLISLVNSTNIKVSKDKRMISPVYNNTTSNISASTSSRGRSNSKRITNVSSVIPINLDSKNRRNSKNKSNNYSSSSTDTETVPNVPEAISQDEGSKSLPWPASLNFTRDLVNKSLKKLRSKLERATNNRRGSRGPLAKKGSNAINENNNSSSKANDSERSFVNNATNNNGEKSDTEKSGQGSKGAKQSWLAVASAVAHSTAAETTDQTSNLQEDDSKPTKYHYYPHNQHLYLLPECATQQVCSAVYLRLNYSQPLCACPTFHEPCSVSTRTDDRHTIPLVTGSNSQVLTLVKTCEPTQEVRECRAPKDWSILALQNSRTGKAHYLVICRCPSPGFLEGPIAHSQPAYARVPGIRVYGMTCVRFPNRTGKSMKLSSEDEPRGPLPNFPWYKLKALFHSFN